MYNLCTRLDGNTKTKTTGEIGANKVGSLVVAITILSAIGFWVLLCSCYHHHFILLHAVPFFPWLFHLNVHREHKPYFQMHKQQQPNISIIIRNHWNSLAQNWIKHFPFYIFDIYRGMFFGCENHWKSLKLKVVHLKPIHRLHRQTTKFIAHSF